MKRFVFTGGPFNGEIKDIPESSIHRLCGKRLLTFFSTDTSMDRDGGSTVEGTAWIYLLGNNGTEDPYLIVCDEDGEEQPEVQPAILIHRESFDFAWSLRKPTRQGERRKNNETL